MQPLELTNKTRTLGAPSNWDDANGECSSLDIHDMWTDNGNLMVSVWEFSEKEIEQIKNGANVSIGIYGTAHPVISLNVE